MGTPAHHPKLGWAICAVFAAVNAGLYVATAEPESIEFKDIPQRGDMRLKRIVAQMRKSTSGEKLYQYASQNGFVFQWDDASKDVGSYSRRKVHAARRYTDDEITFAIVHEINHGWQDIHLGYTTQLNSPRMAWQLGRVAEVGACAYTAHFAAQYKAQTGKELAVSSAIYGQVVAGDYTTLPASQRRYYYDAVLPCFDHIKKNHTYMAHHFERALLIYRLGRNHHDRVDLSIKLAEMTGKDYKPDKEVSPFVALSDADRAKLLSSFFTPTLDVKDVPAELSPADPQKFLALLKRETIPEDKSIADDIERLDKEFHELSSVTEERHRSALARNKERAQAVTP